MFNSDDLVKAIKKAAVEAVNASKPSNMVFGKVISIAPLKVKVDQKLILTEAQLVLSRNVTDYILSVTVDWETESELTTHAHDIETESGSSASFTSKEVDLAHKHKVIGMKTITVHNALKIGEELILMQTAGGQKYIIIDRIGKG